MHAQKRTKQGMGKNSQNSCRVLTWRRRLGIGHPRESQAKPSQATSKVVAKPITTVSVETTKSTHIAASFICDIKHTTKEVNTRKGKTTQTAGLVTYGNSKEFRTLLLPNNRLKIGTRCLRAYRPTGPETLGGRRPPPAARTRRGGATVQ